MRKFKYWWKLKRQTSNKDGNDTFGFHETGRNEYLGKNGGELLEERISLFNGKTHPIRCFSADELSSILTTSSENRALNDQFRWCNGVVDGRKVLVRLIDTEYGNYVREIAVNTEMNSHKNVHKLLGCCLETKHPVLVFEWVEGCLHDQILTGNNPLHWRDRLRIAWEISYAVSYLHTAFPRPIIHRDIKPNNVFLDQQDNTAKLSGFNYSISIPKGKTYVQTLVMGTFGYAPPDYVSTGRVDEKVDVYSFGVFLLVLLTGREAVHRDKKVGMQTLLDWVKGRQALIDNRQTGAAIHEIFDPAITSKATSATKKALQHQLQASLQLALKCTTEEAQHRPTMVEVATWLKSMVHQAL